MGTGLSEIDNSEFELVIELIVAVFFLLMGIFGTATMVRALVARQYVEVTDDKVEYRSIEDFENPCKYTAWQAYMFIVVANSQCDTDIMWLANDEAYKAIKDAPKNNPITFPIMGSKRPIGVILEPTKHKKNFDTYKEDLRKGTGTVKDKGVAQLLAEICESVDRSNIDNWRGLDVFADNPYWLTFGYTEPRKDGKDRIVTKKRLIYDPFTQTKEYRSMYTWTISPAGNINPTH